MKDQLKSYPEVKDVLDNSGIGNITSNGEIVAESFAGMFIGDGSGITGDRKSVV